MVQHILVHVTTREVFLLLIHAKAITGLGTRKVELFLGKYFHHSMVPVFNMSKKGLKYWKYKVKKQCF